MSPVHDIHFALSPAHPPPSRVFYVSARCVQRLQCASVWYVVHFLARACSHDTLLSVSPRTCTALCMCMSTCHVFSPPMCNVQCAMSTCSTTPTVENSRPSFTRDPCTLVNPDARSRCYPISRVTIPRKRRRGVSAPLQQGSAPPKARTMRTATSAANLPAAARSLRAPRRR